MRPRHTGYVRGASNTRDAGGFHSVRRGLPNGTPRHSRLVLHTRTSTATPSKHTPGASRQTEPAKLHRFGTACSSEGATASRSVLGACARTTQLFHPAHWITVAQIDKPGTLYTGQQAPTTNNAPPSPNHRRTCPGRAQSRRRGRCASHTSWKNRLQSLPHSSRQRLHHRQWGSSTKAATGCANARPRREVMVTHTTCHQALAKTVPWQCGFPKQRESACPVRTLGFDGAHTRRSAWQVAYQRPQSNGQAA